MSKFRKLLVLIPVGAACLGCWRTAAQEIQQEPQLQRVETPPAFGTFWMVQKKAPYPFDPFAGQLPIYEISGGIYVIDDSQVDYFGTPEGGLKGGGMMSLLSPPNPGGGGAGGGGTNLLFCGGPTNFNVTYQFSTNGLWLDISVATNNFGLLRIHTPDTNGLYDVFGTTNLAPLALPQLSKTNWVRLVRTVGTPTNFLWTTITPCEAWFQLGTTLDGDSDGLTTAYEGLVSHTNPSAVDTDGDGIGDGVEVQYALNPRVADPAFTISITQPTADPLLP